MLHPVFNPFPVLTTERLVLRRFTHDDAADLFEMRSNEIVMQYIHRPINKTIDDAVGLINVIEELLSKNDGITWCICLKNSNKYIGSIGFWRIEKDNHRAEIGYLLNPAYQGRGIMQEAVLTVIDYGFKELKLHSIEARVSPDNVASVNLLLKNKFIREAYFKEDHLFNGRFEDTMIYSLLTQT
ncbi:ribosomal-protein-alanine N-acetyltransferase [Mucilaginibacter gossypiicola]|uniref:Ribosomal-protein-alanine N-acetyltransferase n=1 Tax=Mucilaginibacter gossypiicola TaxID=551995 RepID=A0A1H8GWV1_9SPHI|nr:GNAT family N-acetyltransferase [Mucilaginibacter gossypiicola]SEN48463.1 ribosomal-protein-alanine N-acetyltransferase [Mucilaginibacter gossypiicola]